MNDVNHLLHEDYSKISRRVTNVIDNSSHLYLTTFTLYIKYTHNSSNTRSSLATVMSSVCARVISACSTSLSTSDILMFMAALVASALHIIDSISVGFCNWDAFTIFLKFYIS